MEGKLKTFLNNCKRLEDEFADKTHDVENVNRGILVSEAFFIRSIIGNLKNFRIIESGRAMGQSTFLLGKIFPNNSIISIEMDKLHTDAKFALDRLSKFNNVQCLFGDSKIMIPDLAKDNDILIIDGPKDMNALLLISSLCNLIRPRFVFIHDAYKGSLLRAWLRRFRDNVTFSDEPFFLQKYCYLDSWRTPAELMYWQDPRNYPAKKVYGGTFACLHGSHLNFNNVEVFSMKAYKFLDKIRKSAIKRFKKRHKDYHPCAN